MNKFHLFLTKLFKFTHSNHIVLNVLCQYHIKFRNWTVQILKFVQIIVSEVKFNQFSKFLNWYACYIINAWTTYHWECSLFYLYTFQTDLKRNWQTQEIWHSMNSLIVNQYKFALECMKYHLRICSSSAYIIYDFDCWVLSYLGGVKRFAHCHIFCLESRTILHMGMEKYFQKCFQHEIKVLCTFHIQVGSSFLPLP